MNAQNKTLDCNLDQSEIGTNYFIESKGEQIPGYFSVKIEKCLAHHEDFSLYGVKEKGASPSEPAAVPERAVYNSNNEIILLFKIEYLNKQLTEDTKEIVIKIKDHEVGRDEINGDSSFHLG